MTRVRPSPEPTRPERDLPPRWGKRRLWREKLRRGFRGLKLGVRGRVSCFVLFFVAVLVLLAAGVLGCTIVEWGLLLGVIGLVFTAELISSAVDQLYHALEPIAKARAVPAVEITTGAFLVAVATAVAVVALVFLHRLGALSSIP